MGRPCAAWFVSLMSLSRTNSSHGIILEVDFYESLVATIPIKQSFDIALIHSYRVPRLRIKIYYSLIHC